MTQKSWPWDTNPPTGGPGDGSAGLNEATAREFLALYFGVQDPTVEGVVHGVLDELEVSGSATPLDVAAGAAICYGLYINDAVATVGVATPALGTTGGRVVLRTNWAGVGEEDSLDARTRLAVVLNSDGVAAIPALTQTPGTTWEISLATFTVSTGGVITVTDDRTFRRVTGVVDTDDLVEAAVYGDKIQVGGVRRDHLQDAAARSVIGRAGATAGEPADIVAGADDRVLARTGGSLAFVQLTAGMVPGDLIDDTMVGNRVPQFYRRQGGNSTNWQTPGSTTYTPTTVRMQGGINLFSGVVSGGSDVDAITFPVAFSNVPLVLVAFQISGNTPALAPGAICWSSDVTASGFNLRMYQNTGLSGDFEVSWLAIGPE
ncbi:MAG: H-type lectin domain-containing protein [Anaerolineales bacterium]|nr:H-type lectin domain-containing protein [Anaerolineales bacterium]